MPFFSMTMIHLCLFMPLEKPMRNNCKLFRFRTKTCKDFAILLSPHLILSSSFLKSLGHGFLSVNLCSTYNRYGSNDPDCLSFVLRHIPGRLGVHPWWLDLVRHPVLASHHHGTGIPWIELGTGIANAQR